MRPAIKKALAQKGYGPIFNAIETSKRQLKQLRYSRGEIQDTLIDMFGDEDPKILQKIKEGVNEFMRDTPTDAAEKQTLKNPKTGKEVTVRSIMNQGTRKYPSALVKKANAIYKKALEKEQKARNKFHKDRTKKYSFRGGDYKRESVEESYDIWAEDGSFGYTMTGIVEAEYGGRKVKLGKPMQGDVKKFKVYVKNPKGNVVKVNFGQGGDAKGGTMKIRKSNPKARASFRARHNCDNPGPRHKARYWSCRKW